MEDMNHDMKDARPKYIKQKPCERQSFFADTVPFSFSNMVLFWLNYMGGLQKL